MTDDIDIASFVDLQLLDELSMRHIQLSDCLPAGTSHEYMSAMGNNV